MGLHVTDYLIVVARQFNVQGNSWVPVTEHEDIKFSVAGKDIFHSIPDHMESKTDVLDLVIIRGKRDLVRQAVCYSLLQHSNVVITGVEGIQVFAEIGLPLGTVCMCK